MSNEFNFYTIWNEIVKRKIHIWGFIKNLYTFFFECIPTSIVVTDFTVSCLSYVYESLSYIVFNIYSCVKFKVLFLQLKNFSFNASIMFTYCVEYISNLYYVVLVYHLILKLTYTHLSHPHSHLHPPTSLYYISTHILFIYDLGCITY